MKLLSFKHLLIVVCVLCFPLVFVGVVFLATTIYAKTSTVLVTVTSAAPGFTAGPAESPAITGANPVNVGNQVTFSATATDPGNNSYYLAVCKTNSITPGAAGAAPTCGGGAWCISTVTGTGDPTTCSYTTLVGDTESNDWYAFVCNNAASSVCSGNSQGSGDSASPFFVNHAPSFTNITDGSADPGGSITINTTASDADTNTANDQVKLIVCASSGATSAGCTVPADELCTAAFTASNPTCNFNVAAVIPAGNVNYYAYVFDSHNFGASNNPYPAVSYTVNNVSPTVSNVTLNGGSNISLTEGTTKSVSMTADVVDNNSCQDVSSMIASLYRTPTYAFADCDDALEADNNHCYPEISCTVVGGTCTSATDAGASYTCTVNVQYHADPTEAGSEFASDTWKNTIEATDAAAATGNSTLATGVEVLSLLGFSITDTVDFDSIPQGTNSGSNNPTIVVTAHGNLRLDTQLSGTDLTHDTDTIPVGNLRYHDATFTYPGASTALTGSDIELELNVDKTTVTGSPATKSIYWGLNIPGGTPLFSYSGTITVTAVEGEII